MDQIINTNIGDQIQYNPVGMLILLAIITILLFMGSIMIIDLIMKGAKIMSGFYNRSEKNARIADAIVDAFIQLGKDGVLTQKEVEEMPKKIGRGLNFKELLPQRKTIPEDPEERRSFLNKTKAKIMDRIDDGLYDKKKLLPEPDALDPNILSKALGLTK